jgi:anti-sigma B factor antagonist
MALMSFEITEESLSGDLALIRLAGAVDLYAAPELKECMNRMIGRGTRRLIFDLSRATYIDSTTLSVVVSGMKSLRVRGGTLAVVCPDAGMAKAFAVTGLERVLSVHDTLEAALTGLDGDHKVASS